MWKVTVYPHAFTYFTFIICHISWSGFLWKVLKLTNFLIAVQLSGSTRWLLHPPLVRCTRLGSVVMASSVPAPLATEKALPLSKVPLWPPVFQWNQARSGIMFAKSISAHVKKNFLQHRLNIRWKCNKSQRAAVTFFFSQDSFQISSLYITQLFEWKLGHICAFMSVWRSIVLQIRSTATVFIEFMQEETRALHTITLPM